VSAKLTEMGIEPRRSTPDGLRRILRELTDDYAALAREIAPGKPDMR